MPSGIFTHLLGETPVRLPRPSPWCHLPFWSDRPGPHPKAGTPPPRITASMIPRNTLPHEYLTTFPPMMSDRLRNSHRPSEPRAACAAISARNSCSFSARRERVPLFGAFGLVSQLGSVDYARRRKFREKLEAWLDLIRTMWPKCPASIDGDGTGLLIDRAHAILPLAELA